MHKTVVNFYSWPLNPGFLRWLFNQTNVLLTVSRFDWWLVVLADTYRNNRKLMHSVRSKGGCRAVVGFVTACLLLFVSACQLWLVNDCQLWLASYWCISWATHRTGFALRFLRLSTGLDWSADWRCFCDCDSLASLSALTALFIRYWLFWQFEWRNFKCGGGWLLLQLHQVFIHCYGYHVISGFRKIVGFFISVNPFGSGLNF